MLAQEGVAEAERARRETQVLRGVAEAERARQVERVRLVLVERPEMGAERAPLGVQVRLA